MAVPTSSSNETFPYDGFLSHGAKAHAPVWLLMSGVDISIELASIRAVLSLNFDTQPSFRKVSQRDLRISQQISASPPPKPPKRL
jgi:hypothetical protein